MSAIEPWNNQPSHLDRSTRRAIEQIGQRSAIESAREQDHRLVAAQRIQGGALLSGELNQWGGMLAVQAQEIAHRDPAAGARANFVLDRLAANGAALIGAYIGGR